jgi:Flp pilus assembly protein protease CpaA
MTIMFLSALSHRMLYTIITTILLSVFCIIILLLCYRVSLELSIGRGSPLARSPCSNETGSHYARYYGATVLVELYYSILRCYM